MGIVSTAASFLGTFFRDRRANRERCAERGRPLAADVTLTTGIVGDDRTVLNYPAREFAVPVVRPPVTIYNLNVRCEYRTGPNGTGRTVITEPSETMDVVPADRGRRSHCVAFVDDELPEDFWRTFDHDHLVRWWAEFDLDDGSRWRVRTDGRPRLLSVGRP